MRELNRSAVIVIPKQPFLDWLHFVDPTSTELTLRDLCREPTIYLMLECESDDEFAHRLPDLSPVIFEDQLNGWWTGQSAWPVERTWTVFQTWFECRYHSVVLDLCDQPLAEYLA